MVKKDTEGKEKRKFSFKMPDVYVLLFFLVIFASIATYFVPSGEYDRVENEENEITEVDPTSFHFVEADPVGISDIFM